MKLIFIIIILVCLLGYTIYDFIKKKNKPHFITSLIMISICAGAFILVGIN